MGKCFSKRDFVCPVPQPQNNTQITQQPQQAPTNNSTTNNNVSMKPRQSRTSALLQALKTKNLQNRQPEQEIPEEEEEEQRDERQKYKTSTFIQSQKDLMYPEYKGRKREVRETKKIYQRGFAPLGGRKFINQYEFVKKLGQGSFGKVKLAARRILDKDDQFAIKIFKKRILRRKKEVYRDENGKVCFRNGLEDVIREIAVMKKLNHYNVIKLHEVINDANDDKIFLVMDYAEKGQLIEWDEDKAKFYYLDPDMDETNFLEEESLRDLARATLKGLAYLHANGVVHRDLKPQNILFDQSGTLKIGMQIIIVFSFHS